MKGVQKHKKRLFNNPRNSNLNQNRKAIVKEE